jgi:autotransporter-associated beta strand protein
VVNAGGGNIQVDDPTQTLTLSGLVSGSGPLTLTGTGATAGNLVLSGSITYTGALTVSEGTLTAYGNLSPAANAPMNIASGAAVQSFGTLNLRARNSTSSNTKDVISSGVLRLAGTNGSPASPDIFFGNDHSSNSFWGVSITGGTLDLGSAQRYINSKSGHDSFANYNTASDAWITSSIVGAGGITFSGSAYNGQGLGNQYAELILAGSNSFSGKLEVDQGAVFMNNASALTQANQVVLVPSFNNSYSHFFLFGNNTTISNLQSSGSFQANAAVANGTPTMTQSSIANTPATLTVIQTANTTFAGLIADKVTDNYNGGSYVPGPLSLTVSGASTLTLTRTDNSYTGATALAGGVLSVASLANGGSNSSIGSSTNDPSNLLLMGGALQYSGSGGSTDRLFTLDVAGGTIAASGSGPINWTNGGAIAFSGAGVAGVPRVLTLGGNNSSYNTLAATLTDAGDTSTAVVKTGQGAWLLTGTNTYTGPTTVQQGQLYFAAGANLSGPLVVSGGSAIAQGGLTSGTTASVQGGLLALYGGSSFQGAMTMNGGTLSVNNPASSGPTVSTTIGGLNVSSPSILNLQAGSTWSTSVPFFTGSGALTMNSTATLNIGAFGPLGVGNYPLFSMSGGTLNGSAGLSGFALGALPSRATAHLAANNVGGVETVFLDITAADSIKWTGSVNSLWDTATPNWKLVTAGGTATYIALPEADSVTFDDTAASGAVTLPVSVQPTSLVFNNNTLNYTFRTTTGTDGIGGATALIKNGNANVTLVTNNTYTSGTSINGGTLTLGDGVTAGAGAITGNVSLNNAATGTAVLAFNRPDTMTFAGVVSGSGSLVQTGTGTTIVTGSSTYNGATTILNGALQIGNADTTGMIPLTGITNNASLIFDRKDATTFTGTIAGPGTTFVNGGTLQLGDGFSPGVVSGPLVTNATVVLDSPSGTYSSAISGSGGIGLVGNTLTITGTNTYSGTTNIANGHLMVQDLASIGSTSGTANILFAGGILEYTGNNGTAAHGLTVGSGGATVQVDNASQTLTLLGLATGAGALTVPGPGSLTLGGPLSVGAGVNVTGGTLSTLGALNTYLNSPLNIAAGAVVRSAATLNLNVNQNGSVGSVNITGQGTLQLVGTAGSSATPDIYFGPDHNGNSYWGASIDSGLTLDLGNRQRYIDAKTGHNSVSVYYTSTWTDARISANIIGSGGITYTAESNYGGLWAELLLSASNSFSGPVEVDRGAIFLDNALALTQSNNLTLSNSDSTYSRFFLTGNTATISNLQSLGTTQGSTGIANGNPRMTGPASVVNPGQLTIDQTMNTTFGGTIADKLDDKYTTGGTSAYVPGPLSIVVTGSGSLTLTGTGTFTGGTTVAGGRLIVASPNALQDGSNLSVGDPELLAFLPAPTIPSEALGSAPATAAGVASVPEPGTAVLVVAGLGVACFVRRFRRRRGCKEV